MDISIGPRIPYEKRTNWLAEIHYQYGRKMHLHDIDYIIDNEPQESRTIWMEHVGKIGVALAEFKNETETIELYKYGQLIWLADGRDIPAYIVVGTQNPYTYYYVIPLNDACKRIPTLDKPRYFSERNYVKFLYYIRKMKIDENTLQSLNNNLPTLQERFKPNIIG